MANPEQHMTEAERRERYYSQFRQYSGSFTIFEKGRKNSKNEPYAIICHVTERQIENWFRNGDLADYSA